MRAEAKQVLERRRSELLERGELGAELADVDAALARLEAGTWGSCERCAAAIGRGRLRALPEARHCLRCSVDG